MEALSPTMEEGRLVKWNKNEGDAVKTGDVLAEVETDKAVMELVARGDGVLRKRLANEGDASPVGTLLAVIASPDENIDAIVGASTPAAAPAQSGQTAQAGQGAQAGAPSAASTPPQQQAAAPSAGASAPSAGASSPASRPAPPSPRPAPPPGAPPQPKGNGAARWNPGLGSGWSHRQTRHRKCQGNGRSRTLRSS